MAMKGSDNISTPAMLSRCALAAALFIFTAAGFAQQSPQPSNGGTSQLTPVSLPHLYWHFLVYLNFLDTKADELTAQGKSSDWLRNDLQTRLGFSDADFAPIRVSSQRLAPQAATFNEQIKALKGQAPSAANQAQLLSLVAQREAAINAEIGVLRQELSPEKRAALEAFMTQFFAPKKLSVQIPAAGTNQ